ncbi:hypothetical protein [Nostocoides sp. HKS02]|uniref:hypothetical protein n=1 Tax=Nostocoides sp. HKS02 TaxID=1813880 RepID=UPI0012B4A1BE|nr:hypothetical protein [Tetrasphaera sp. HKS02]QGN58150.1 hypothetical protein GKE56_09915 [Tetrasphaera sp. HKS02]
MTRLVGRQIWSGMPGMSHPRAAGRCLGSQLTAYADRAMDPVTLLHWDRHVLACACCRAAVAQERRVLQSLRSPAAPAVSGDLRGLLLALAADSAPTSAVVHPIAPIPVAPVPVVDRGMPAMHRSARRATVFAGLAAGATAAAAVGLAVTGTGAITPSPAVTPGLVQRTRTSTPGFAPAAFTIANLGAARGAFSGQTPRPAVSITGVRSAQSTP